jgi:hypothetical protein
LVIVNAEFEFEARPRTCTVIAVLLDTIEQTCTGTVMKRLLQIGLSSAVATGLAPMIAIASPFSLAAPAKIVSIAEQVKHRRKYHEHYHRHYHQHRHYHYGPGVYYGAPANFGGWYPAYRPYYGGYYYAPSVGVPEFYGLDVAPRFLHFKPRYRLFHDW